MEGRHRALVRPYARAVVFSYDEKTQCQALDRTQPSLPLKPGRAGTMTHDYKRNGTIEVFAAMNIATGQVLTDLHKGHTGADVLRFFKQIDASVPRGLGVHVILDNLSAHWTPEITKWLAHKNRRRWHLHFTPTCSSWLNLIERRFKELTDKRLRRGVFTSVADLTTAITMWAQHWNENPKPFIWKANADDIITKVRRGRAALNQIIHRQTTRSAPARRHGHDPEVTFAQPEVAAFGVSPANAQGSRLLRVLDTHHDEIDRAITEDTTRGITRLVADHQGHPVGATIVGPRAGESLAELVLAARNGLHVRDLAAAMHAYPTYGDGVWKAAIADVQHGLRRPVVAAVTNTLGRLRRRWLSR